jgi:hypothetical protein
MKHPVFVVISILPSLNACGVYMASKKEGADFDTLAACKTKTCLLANDAQPLTITGLPENTEPYKVLKAHGSISRAAMHGVLDVQSLGLWEVAGTPIEGSFDKDNFYGIRVAYEPGTENINQIALAQ